jgi:hypothetical protein
MPVRLLTLAEAAKILSPEGRVTAHTLRTEARRGRLKLVQLGGKHFVTEDALDELVAAATIVTSSPCPDADCQPDCTFAEAAMTAEAHTSFSTDRKKLAQAQALMIAQELRRPSGATSSKTTSRPVAQTGRTNSSSPKS